VLSRIFLLFGAMTARQRSVISAFGVIPVLTIFALLAGSAFRQPEFGAAVALGLFVAGALGAVAYLANHRRLSRRLTTDSAAAVAVTAVGDRPSQAIVEDDLAVLGQSATANRVKWLYKQSKFSNQAIRDHGFASRTIAARDYFALRLTNWRFDWESLKTPLSDPSIDAGTTLALLGPIDGNHGITLARMILSQQLEHTDTFCGIRLLQLSTTHVSHLGLVNREIALQLLIHLADEMPRDQVAETSRALLSALRLGDYPARFMQLDLLNPWGVASGKISEELWLAAANGMFTRSGLEPIVLRSSGETAFDRLDASPGTPVLGGPLVTVIMTCHNPGSALVTAVRSMIAQTWQSWELLITDDASSEDPTGMLAEVSALDPRIRVIRNAVNAGTYVRRNEAIIESRAEFVTMQDSDDWVHPRRLELQMRHLLKNDHVLANLSQSVRMSETLTFTQPRGISVRIAESSLLFRKRAVISRIGYFDSVRKAADSEFRLRLEASIGEKVTVVDLEAPLSLVRFHPASLSGSDLGVGWMHPARIAYRGAQAQWRRERLESGLSLVLTYPLEERPFPAHPHLAGGLPLTHDLDVLFVLDSTGRGEAGAVVANTASDIRDLLTAGLRVGIRRALALGELRPMEPTHSDLQALVNSGDVVEVLSIDACRATLTVLCHPECLVGVGEGEETVESDRVIVVGSQGRVPSVYAARGLANLGADPHSVVWMSRSTWAVERTALCGEVPSGR
jgi:hypothetical protein